MHLLKTLAITIGLFSSFTSKAQYIDLIGSSEKQILDKVSADYPTVKKDTTEVGSIPVLNFEDQEKASSCSFFFYPKRDACYMIRSWAPIRFINSYIKIANRRYTKIGNNLWKTYDGTVQIRIMGIEESVLTTFSKIPSGKEI